jgi:hypothetical protein
MTALVEAFVAGEQEHADPIEGIDIAARSRCAEPHRRPRPGSRPARHGIAAAIWVRRGPRSSKMSASLPAARSGRSFASAQDIRCHGRRASATVRDADEAGWLELVCWLLSGVTDGVHRLDNGA